MGSRVGAIVMKSNIIEITVSGKTGSGKSEVLEVISNALFSHYGIDVNITGSTCQGAIDEAKETGQSAKHNNTVFVLYEQNISGKLTEHKPKAQWAPQLRKEQE